MSTIPSHIQSSLKAYTSSSSPFKIIHSIPTPLFYSPPPPPISALLILDSSFNPPTRAHASLIQQAISQLQTQHPHKNALSSPPPKGRILLLLSTKNADKPSAPAATQDRVHMMSLFAQDLWNRCSTATTTTESNSPTTTGATIGASGATATNDDDMSLCFSGIDIAVSPQPRFLEKSIFLATPSEENPYSNPKNVPQWHLLGFDTLVRVLDGKYYEGGELGVLRPLFEGENRVFVVRRGGDDEQEEFVRKLRIPGGFGGKGWEVEWGAKVELVDGFDGEEVSSTAVRAAAREGREGDVAKMCAEMVAEYVMANGLYREE